MGNTWNRRARWAASAAAMLMVAGVLASCGGTPAPGGPVCNDLVPPLITGEPPSAPVSGWWTSDTRANGSVTNTTDFGGAPGNGCSSIKFTTGLNTQVSGVYQDKAQLFSYEQAGSTTLASINSVSYWAYRSSASTGGGAPTVALNIQVLGASVPGNFATLVYEPYNQASGQGAIINNTWQKWNATDVTPNNGVWWSTKILSGPGSQAAPVAFAALKALYSDAVLGGYGFNLGSNNPNQIVAGDGLEINGVTTNF